MLLIPPIFIHITLCSLLGLFLMIWVTDIFLTTFSSSSFSFYCLLFSAQWSRRDTAAASQSREPSICMLPERCTYLEQQDLFFHTQRPFFFPMKLFLSLPSNPTARSGVGCHSLSLSGSCSPSLPHMLTQSPTAHSLLCLQSGWGQDCVIYSLTMLPSLRRHSADGWWMKI